MICIVGGGIAGLSLGYRLMREGRDVIVLEASERPGGAIRSMRTHGVLVEGGPQALQGGAPDTLALVESLGLELVRADDAAKERFLLWKGRLVKLPGGPGGLATTPLLTPGARLRLLCEPFRPRGPGGTESVRDFFARRLGDEVGDVLIDAFVAGVFGGDARRLEIGSAFPLLAEWEREKGSLLRGALSAKRGGGQRGLFSFPDGLEELPLALAAALGDRFHALSRVERIEGTTVHTSMERFEAERVVIACPAHAARRFLPELDLDVPTAPIAAVTLVYDPLGPLPGFGWLAPGPERKDVLGALMVSNIFPSHAAGKSVIRVMRGGARAPALATEPEEVQVAAARAVLREVQGIEAEPLFSHVAVHGDGIPQYDLGHAARVARLQSAIPGVSFVGWGYTGIGVNQAIAAAAQVTL